MKPEHWVVMGEATPVDHEGKESFLVKKGAIMVKDVNLRDGIIEADMNFTSQRGFPGFAFRVQDENNFENFYIRPHQSGNPDATQYTPVFNGYAGWQLYHGEGYSKAFPFKFNQWHHIKVELDGLQARIFIDDMEKPFMQVIEMKREWKTGRIGFLSGGVPVYFANVQYTVKEGRAAPATLPVPANGTGGLITRWKISNTIDPNLFRNKYQLTNDLKSKLVWSTRNSEPSGMINLAKFTGRADTSKGIVARIDFESSAEEPKEISFGFSDYVMVYLNGKVLYLGADNFLSRDYRFLGTVGFFDRLFLPVKKGRNELWFVVAEDFGGWGLKAKFENMDKITLK